MAVSCSRWLNCDATCDGAEERRQGGGRGAQQAGYAQGCDWSPGQSQSAGRKLSGIGGSPSAERRSAQCIASTPPILAKSVRKAGSWSLATIFVSATAAQRSSEAAYCKTSVSLASFGGG